MDSQTQQLSVKFNINNSNVSSQFFKLTVNDRSADKRSGAVVSRPPSPSLPVRRANGRGRRPQQTPVILQESVSGVCVTNASITRSGRLQAASNSDRFYNFYSFYTRTDQPAGFPEVTKETAVQREGQLIALAQL